jgi:hypothetical protein
MYSPKQYSNTYLLYILGWRGINVDATLRALIGVREAVRAPDKPLEQTAFRNPAPRGSSEAWFGRARQLSGIIGSA